MKDIRPWKKTGFLVFAAALGGIISVPGSSDGTGHGGSPGIACDGI